MKEQKKNTTKTHENDRKMANRTTIESVVRIECDPLGSYTGVPQDPYSMPVQDVDDL